MIWVLDDKQNNVEQLINRIKQFALPVSNASGVHIHFSADGINQLELNKTQKRNLLLIAKEAINNCVKYADCKNIHVIFERSNGETTLIIQDDGCGFDENNITPGNGLRNIRERAKQIRYTASVTSRKGEGAKIVVAKK